MNHCIICGQAIDTEDALIIFETHAQPGHKGCSIEFKWMPAAQAIKGKHITLGSAKCAMHYLQRWIFAHMRRADIVGQA
jgi:hypothetical protein